LFSWVRVTLSQIGFQIVQTHSHKNSGVVI
jgi:hypothetical protein